MAVEISRVGWLQMYSQMRAPNAFLSRFFTVKPGGIYNGRKIAIDIKRSGEKVAVAITECSGPNLNTKKTFTTKEFEPPVYGEAFNLDVCELLDRREGVDPYSAAYEEYNVSILKIMMDNFVEVGDMIQRAVELQASQVLQTGQLSLKNTNGDVTYEIDYKPKATHFPTAGTVWGAGGDDPIADLISLAEVVRADGKIDIDMAVFGRDALEKFLDDPKVKDRLDNRRMNLGQIEPRFADSGATYYGDVQLGTYLVAIWAYPDTYEDPETSTVLQYVDPAKVILLSSRTRLDMTSAKVPRAIPDPRVAGLMPGRISSRDGGFDVTPNLYTTANGKQVMGELESRPLLIPVQIDGYGCLDTGL